MPAEVRISARWSLEFVNGALLNERLVAEFHGWQPAIPDVAAYLCMAYADDGCCLFCRVIPSDCGHDHGPYCKRSWQIVKSVSVNEPRRRWPGKEKGETE